MGDPPCLVSLFPRALCLFGCSLVCLHACSLMRWVAFYFYCGCRSHPFRYDASARLFTAYLPSPAVLGAGVFAVRCVRLYGARTQIALAGFKKKGQKWRQVQLSDP
jgi:hypothetical protein